MATAAAATSTSPPTPAPSSLPSTPAAGGGVPPTPDLFGGSQGDIKQLERDILGDDYDYGAPIKAPSEMGMSSKGTLDVLGRDITGILAYMNVMVAGGGRASKVNGPLGDKFFMPTASKCLDKDSQEQVTRSIYINNIPDGSIPFMAKGAGGAPFSEYRGLLPGIIANVTNINPLQILQAFMTGANPDCRLLQMEQIKQIKPENGDPYNESTMVSAYVIDTDIEEMNPCWFPDGTNPITKNTCRSGFTTMSPQRITTMSAQMPRGFLVQLYFTSLGLLGLYILLKLLRRGRINS